MKKNTKKGITLIEIIITLAILSIIIIPLSNMVITSVRIEKSSSDKQQANALAQRVMEYVKSASFHKEDNRIKIDYSNLDLDVISQKDHYGEFRKSDDNGEYYVKVSSEEEYEAKVSSPGNSDYADKWSHVNSKNHVEFIFNNNHVNIIKDKADDSQNASITISDTGITTSNLYIKLVNKNSKKAIEYKLKQGENELEDNAKEITISDSDDILVKVSLNNNSPNVVINVVNELSADKNRLKLFIEQKLASSQNKAVPKYTVLSQGKVKTYTRMKVPSDNYGNVKKVYKFTVEVYKDEEMKKLLQKIEGYKYE